MISLISSFGIIVSWLYLMAILKKKQFNIENPLTSEVIRISLSFTIIITNFTYILFNDHITATITIAILLFTLLFKKNVKFQKFILNYSHYLLDIYLILYIFNFLLDLLIYIYFKLK